MTESEVRKASRGEWVLTSDMDTARTALMGMLAKRRMSQNGLAAQMGITSTSLFANFLARKQANVRLDSWLKAAEAMGFEVVVREPEAGRKRKERLAKLRAERGKPTGTDSGDDEGLVSLDDPDRALKLRMLDGMKDPDNRASLEGLFRQLREEEAELNGGV